MASKTETVMLALKAALEVNYPGTMYPPAVVLPMLDWPSETALDSTQGTIYLLRPVLDTGGPGPESCRVTHRLRVLILAAQRYKSATPNPFAQSPTRWQVSVDLAADVEEKLHQDEKLATLTGQSAVVTVFDGPFGIDHERHYLPKWILPEMEIRIRYVHEKDTR